MLYSSKKKGECYWHFLFSQAHP